MPLPKIAEVRELTDEQIGEEIVAVKRELFNLRLKEATRQGEIKPHQFKHLQHRQSQLFTVERERQLVAERNAQGKAFEGTVEEEKE